MQFFLRMRTCFFVPFVSYPPLLAVHLLHIIAQSFVMGLVICNILIINKKRGTAERVFLVAAELFA